MALALRKGCDEFVSTAGVGGHQPRTAVWPALRRIGAIAGKAFVMVASLKHRLDKAEHF
jgi:hypothetical protein